MQHQPSLNEFLVWAFPFLDASKEFISVHRQVRSRPRAYCYGREQCNFFCIATLRVGAEHREPSTLSRHGLIVFDDVFEKAKHNGRVEPDYELITTEDPLSAQHGWRIKPHKYSDGWNRTYVGIIENAAAQGWTDVKCTGVNRLVRCPGGRKPGREPAVLRQWNTSREPWDAQELCEALGLPFSRKRSRKRSQGLLVRDQMMSMREVRWLLENWHGELGVWEGVPFVKFRCPIEHESTGWDVRGDATYWPESDFFKCLHESCCPGEWKWRGEEEERVWVPDKHAFDALIRWKMKQEGFEGLI